MKTPWFYNLNYCYWNSVMKTSENKDDRYSAECPIYWGGNVENQKQCEQQSMNS